MLQVIVSWVPIHSICFTEKQLGPTCCVLQWLAYGIHLLEDASSSFPVSLDVCSVPSCRNYILHWCCGWHGWSLWKVEWGSGVRGYWRLWYIWNIAQNAGLQLQSCWVRWWIHASENNFHLYITCLINKHIIHFTLRLQKLIYQHLLTACFMKISLQSPEQNAREVFMKQPVSKCR